MVTSTFTTPFRSKPNWYGKFQPSSEIKRAIASLHRLDNWHGILQVMEDWLWIFGSIFLSLSAWHYLPSAIAWMIYLLAVLLIGGRMRHLRFLIQNRIWNPQENPVERIARLTMLTVILSSIVALGWGQELVLYWVVPLLTTANWLGSVIQLAEHYPLLKMDYPLDIYYSRNRLLNPLWNIIIGVHSDGYHQIHHLYPCLPFWNMKKAHHILLEDELYASLNQEKGIVAMFKQVIGLNQVCQS